MPEATKTGSDGKLYRNTGTHASATWVEIDEAQDVSIPWAVDKAETSDRGSRFKKYEHGMIETGINFGFNYRSGNANFTALLALATPPVSAVQFAAMDGAIATSGSQGVRFFGKAFGANMEQPLADGMKIDFEIAPAYAEESSAVVDPDWYVVS